MLRFISLRYFTVHYIITSQGFFLLHKMHPQVSILVEMLLNLRYISLRSYDFFWSLCGNIAMTAADFSEYIFFCFSFISLSQGSRSTGGHSWRCRGSTGCGSSFAPYLETARYYPGMCWLRVIGGQGWLRLTTLDSPTSLTFPAARLQCTDVRQIFYF